MVDNKFRKYVLLDKYREFKEKTECDYSEMKTDVNHVVTVVAKVTKNLPNDISVSVRKATQHLRAKPNDGAATDLNVD